MREQNIRFYKGTKTVLPSKCAKESLTAQTRPSKTKTQYTRYIVHFDTVKWEKVKVVTEIGC